MLPSLIVRTQPKFKVMWSKPQASHLWFKFSSGMLGCVSFTTIFLPWCFSPLRLCERRATDMSWWTLTRACSAGSLCYWLNENPHALKIRSARGRDDSRAVRERFSEVEDRGTCFSWHVRCWHSEVNSHNFTLRLIFNTALHNSERERVNFR